MWMLRDVVCCLKRLQEVISVLGRLRMSSKIGLGTQSRFLYSWGESTGLSPWPMPSIFSLPQPTLTNNHRKSYARAAQVKDSGIGRSLLVREFEFWV